jgi:hypothetical protein
MNRVLNEKNFDGEGFRCISAAQATSQRFKGYFFYNKKIKLIIKGYRFMAEFLILNVEYPDGLYPDEVLKSIFEATIGQLEKGIGEMGLKANHFIIQFNSSLMDHSVPMHLHKLDLDSVEVLLHKFRAIDQSGEEKGKDSLVTQSFLIDATSYALPPPKMPSKQSRKRKYPGRGKKHFKNMVFQHHINQKALIPLDNEDNFCLFRAFEILRRKATLTTNHYKSYKANEQKQNEDVLKMIRWCDIPEDEESYDITIVGQKIQNYYDAHFPNKFKIMAFGNVGRCEPIWKSEPAGEVEIVLSVLYQDEHYTPIINVGKFLSGSNLYCYAVGFIIVYLKK